MSVIVKGAEVCRPPTRQVCMSTLPVPCPPKKSKQKPAKTPIMPCNKPCCPHMFPKKKPCCYDLPCKADCFNHPPGLKPSGRYANTVWYPGEWPPSVNPCRATACPNPPYHPCCTYTCNRHV